MKNSASLAVVVSLFLTAMFIKPVLGEEGAATRQLFDKLDGNQDGKVSADEVGFEKAKYFKRLVRIGDKDGDGVLTKEEFLTALEKKKRPVVDAGGSSGKPNRRQQAGIFFQRLDANGDGQISLDEVPEKRKEKFARMLRRAGKSETDSINKKQFMQLHAQRGKGKKSGQRGAGKQNKKTKRAGRQAGQSFGSPRFFRMLDANGDSRLDKTELAKLSNIFDTLDTNKDGSLDRRELLGSSRQGIAANRNGKGKKQKKRSGKGANRRRGGKFVQNLMKRFDTDNDAKISKDEAPPRLAKNFERIDTNADGAVDADELKKGLRQFGQGKRGQGKRGQRQRGQGQRKKRKP